MRDITISLYHSIDKQSCKVEKDHYITLPFDKRRPLRYGSSQI